MEPRYMEAARSAEGKAKTGHKLSRTQQQCLQDFDKLPDAASVPVHVVGALLTLSVSAVWRRTRDGKLPEPVRHGGMTRWNVGQLRKALAGAGA